MLTYQVYQIIVHNACDLLSSHGAKDPSTPSLADLRMLSGSGSECLTIAPYRPYSAMMLLRPHVFSVLRHFARRFWNHTYIARTDTSRLISSTMTKISIHHQP